MPYLHQLVKWLALALALGLLASLWLPAAAAGAIGAGVLYLLLTIAG